MSPPSEADSVASLSAKLAVDASIDQQALRRLGNVYGGLNTMLACYLRDGFVLFDHSKARTRIMRSLQHRVDHQLDERAADLAEVIERHPGASPSDTTHQLYSMLPSSAYTKAAADLPR